MTTTTKNTDPNPNPQIEEISQAGNPFWVKDWLKDGLQGSKGWFKKGVAGSKGWINDGVDSAKAHLPQPPNSPAVDEFRTHIRQAQKEILLGVKGFIDQSIVAIEAQKDTPPPPEDISKAV